MLKIYEIEGKLWQFEEGEQPEGAREVKRAEVGPPEEKKAAPKNKGRRAAVK